MALNSLQRLDAEEELMDRLATCIYLGHPHRNRMMAVNLRQVQAFGEDRLLAMSERLRVWIESKRDALALAQDGALAAPAEGVS